MKPSIFSMPHDHLSHRSYVKKSEKLHDKNKTRMNKKSDSRCLAPTVTLFSTSVTFFLHLSPFSRRNAHDKGDGVHIKIFCLNAAAALLGDGAGHGQADPAAARLLGAGLV